MRFWLRELRCFIYVSKRLGGIRSTLYAENVPFLAYLSKDNPVRKIDSHQTRCVALRASNYFEAKIALCVTFPKRRADVARKGRTSTCLL